MNPEGTVYNAMGRINRLSVLCMTAYDIAVKHGFKGTEEEWLASLKGDPGDGSGFIDQKTGKTHILFVSDGKLYMEEVSE